MSREITAACALCERKPSGPGSEDCPCETKALRLAIDRAEKKWLESWMARVHDWVTNAAVRYITTTFATLKEQRMYRYKQYVYSLPYYRDYRQWGGKPPIHPGALHELKMALIDADRRLQAGVNADWKACVLKYPEVLDYYYGSIEVAIPRSSPDLPLGGHPGPRPHGPTPGFPTSPTMKRRSRRGSMGVPMDPVDALGFDALDLGHDARRRRRDSAVGSYVVSGRGRAPMAPEPPIAPTYPYGFV